MAFQNLVQQIETFWLICGNDDDDHDFTKDISSDILFIYNRAKYLANTHKDPLKCLKLCEATLESLWEQLNVGHWSSVPLGLRILYAKASLLKCLLLLRNSKQENDFQDIQTALSTCDMGLLLGAPLKDNMLHEIAQSLSLEQSKQVVFEDEVKTVNEPDDEVLSEEGLPEAEKLPSLECPSLQAFCKQHFSVKKPVILTKCIDHWPARKKWTANYLKQKAGGRTVPIELGAHYADEEWSQQLMTMNKFVDEYFMLSPNDTSKPVGYLAQHLLFDQIPDLRDDIYEPEYCFLHDPKADEEADNEEVPAEVNAWFGPAGTLSPLHFDPKHNILAQVKGYKRVWLFSPEDSANLYPHESDTLLSNTARVDPEKPDLLQFPNYAKARGMRCLLSPGDCLYIPPKWWHYVRALTQSMSVSFWWE